MNRKHYAFPLWIVTLAAGSASASTPSPDTTYGSYAYISARHCQNGVAGPCDLGPQFELDATGGAQQTSQSQTLTVDDGSAAGSYGTAAAELDGTLGLPILHAVSSASGDGRINASVFGYQGFTYTGSTDLRFGIAATLHMSASSVNPPGADPEDRNILPGGAALDAFVEIWTQSAFVSAFGSNPNIEALLESAFEHGCGAPGILGSGSATLPGNGGSGSVGLTAGGCTPVGLTLTPGEQIVVVADLSSFTSRGGFIDASHSLVTDLDPALGDATIAALKQTLVPASWSVAVPEPASWATFVGGFGMIGGAMRRRRPLRLSPA